MRGEAVAAMSATTTAQALDAAVTAHSDAIAALLVTATPEEAKLLAALETQFRNLVTIARELDAEVPF